MAMGEDRTSQVDPHGIQGESLARVESCCIGRREWKLFLYQCMACGWYGGECDSWNEYIFGLSQARGGST